MNSAKSLFIVAFLFLLVTDVFCGKAKLLYKKISFAIPNVYRFKVDEGCIYFLARSQRAAPYSFLKKNARNLTMNSAKWVWDHPIQFYYMAFMFGACFAVGFHATGFVGLLWK